jgi:hypothetical protein
MNKAYLDMIHWQTTQKSKQNQSHLADFLETFSSAKKEQGTASTDCKSGGFKHKIFKCQHRIVSFVIVKSNTSCRKEN